MASCHPILGRPRVLHEPHYVLTPTRACLSTRNPKIAGVVILSPTARDCSRLLRGSCCKMMKLTRNHQCQIITKSTPSTICKSQAFQLNPDNPSSPFKKGILRKSRSTGYMAHKTPPKPHPFPIPCSFPISSKCPLIPQNSPYVQKATPEKASPW